MMTFRLSETRLRAAAFAAMAAAVGAFGCTTQVEAVGGGTGGAGGSGGKGTTTTGAAQGGAGGGSSSVSTGGAGTGGGVQSSSAIAMLYSQIPSSGVGGGTSVSSSGTSGGPDPNSVSVFISGNILSCGAPFDLGPCTATAAWEVAFNIPPALQAPGTYSLQQLNATASMQQGNPDGSCMGGGGSFWNGQVTIVSIDASQVVGSLSGTDTTFGFDANGPFTALRCGSATSCMPTPAPVGALDNCGGTAGVGTGSPFMCESMSCDQAGNKWDATCDATGCTCTYNGQAWCTCTFGGGAQGCDGIQGNGCCPAPFPDP